MKSGQAVNVAAGILWRGEYFLAALRPEGKPRAGFWEFPGGKQEPGENIEDTLRRELREELAVSCLQIEPWQQITHEYPDLTVTLHFMHVTEFTGEPTPLEGQELRWVTPQEARELSFLPADKSLVAVLERPRRVPTT